MLVLPTNLNLAYTISTWPKSTCAHVLSDGNELADLFGEARSALRIVEAAAHKVKPAAAAVARHKDFRICLIDQREESQAAQKGKKGEAGKSKNQRRITVQVCLLQFCREAIDHVFMTGLW